MKTVKSELLLVLTPLCQVENNSRLRVIREIRGNCNQIFDFRASTDRVWYLLSCHCCTEISLSLLNSFKRTKAQRGVWRSLRQREEDEIRVKQPVQKAGSKQMKSEDTILCLSLMTRGACKINTRTWVKYYSCQTNSHSLTFHATMIRVSLRNSRWIALTNCRL